MIIVCAWCKEKRKETAKIWHKVDNYATLIKRTSVSHGICPTCEKNFIVQEPNSAQRRVL